MKTKMQTMNWTTVRSNLLALALAVAPVSALAQTIDRPPGQISYQGYLLDANGIPLATNTPKNFNVIFAIYNDSTAAAAANTLWAEQQVVTVDRGYFTVLLGAGSAVSGVFNTNDLSGLFYTNNASSRYLGITVQGLSSPDLEIAPRLRLTTSPYALLAANATALTGPSAAANGLVVKNGLVVDGANQNSGPLNTNNALTFGSGASEGIASQRSATPAGLQNDLALFTAGQPRLTILNNGNVGINQVSPGFPLNFPSVIGDKISLYGNSGNSFGFGIQNGQIQIHTDTSASDVVFGYGSSSSATSLTETMRVKGTGKVSIGGSSVYGGLGIRGDWSNNFGIGYEMNGMNNGGAVISMVSSGWSWGIGMDVGQSRLGFFNARDASGRGTEVMSISAYLGLVGIGTTNPANRLSVAGAADFSGNVGIGTTTPTRAKLEVVGGVDNSTALGNRTYAYFQNGSPLTGTLTGGNSNNVSIYASGTIIATLDLVLSDRRIKNVIGRSDSKADLKTLMAIEITDYTHKDTVVHGGRELKKVIAQQVEQVYPRAVSQSTDVVPDIYQAAIVEDGWVLLASDLKVGDRVRLMGEKEEGIHEVLEVREGAFRTAFKPVTAKVFVYGREVKDFRSVDYDAISMLNVSATQELARQLAAEKTEVAKLRAENEGLTAKLSAIEARFARLEKAQDASAGDKELVSLQRN